MIINEDLYTCSKCHHIFLFDTSKPYNPICPKCNIKLVFRSNTNRDPDNIPRAESDSNYDCTKDPNHIMYGAKKIIRCPYCKSGNTSKIGVVGRSVSFGLFGFGSSKVGKNFHCNDCKADF